jgi:hypothetical protein
MGRGPRVAKAAAANALDAGRPGILIKNAPVTSLQGRPHSARIELVTHQPNGVPPKQSWRARLRQIRQLYRLIQTVDVRQLKRLVAEFRDTQLALEARQNELPATVGSLAADIATWQQTLLPNSNLQTLAMLNIKNLGYEIGRALGEREFSKPIPPSSNQPLKSKICTQNDFSEDWIQLLVTRAKNGAILSPKILGILLCLSGVVRGGQARA